MHNSTRHFGPENAPFMNKYLFMAMMFLVPAVSMGSVYIVDINASNANDDNAGTLAAPFKTIGKAASIMQPGDTCLIRQGTYREYINPARGGTSEQTRITYKAYPNEIPVILGSEKITGWVKESGNVYKAEVLNSLFGSFNPFAIRLNDPRGWIWYGTEYHLGDVYVNGESYKEKLSQSDVATSPKSWFASISASATTIRINYIGSSTPASETVEINVRESIIRPATAGVGYITIEGLTLRHSAAQWASCEDDQRGLIDFNGGRSWIVQNCRISDARNTAITSRGNSPTGHHIVRNNLIERCGQCGLAGNNGGWSFSLVEGNIIQDINMKDEFGGAETAMFKTHQPVDLVIRNNLFRRLKGHGWQFGIWLDVSAQGCRITGNVFADLISEGILLEVCHGPNLIDNNIFIPGSTGTPGFRTCSQNSILVHNLFFNSSDSRYIDGNGSPRSTPWFVPHTRTQAGGGQTLNLNDKYFNNLYIKGRNDVPQASQFASDFNAYFDGATGTSWGDKSSIVNSGTTANFMVTHLTNGVQVQFSMNDETIALKCPLITKDYIGIINPPNQGIENPDLTPITVDLDINGKTRNVNGPTVGPFEDIQAGLNSYTILFGVRDSANGATSIDQAPSDKFFGCIWKEWNSVGDCPASFTPLFNQVTSENAGKWESCETTRGKFSWTTLDAMYAWGDSTGSLVKQHCFVWGQQYPSWLNTHTNADTVKAIVTNWISTFLQRYGSKTDLIDVVNEPLSTPCPYASKLGSADPEWGWVVWSFQTTRNLCNQYAPNAKLILNDYGVVNDDNKTARAVSLINILKAKNLIDGFGEQGHFLEGADPAKIRRNLNRLVATGIPIYISEFELSIGNDQDQLNQYKKIFPIFWENPGVKGVTLWGYQQGTMWQADGYLLRSDGTERPALTWLKSYLAATTAASKNIHGSPAQR